MRTDPPQNAEPLPETQAQAGWLGRGRLWVVAGVLVLAIVIWLVLGPEMSVAWEIVRGNIDSWQIWAHEHRAWALVLYLLAFTLATALPLPVLTVMCLLAGALFGRWLGTATASIAYTAGVTATFLVVRGVLHERVKPYTAMWLSKVQRGVERDGAYYLLALRLMPSIPYFVVNVLMALTPIRARTYILVSWIGVLPYTFLCAGVGTEVAAMESPAEVVSLPVLAALAALALMPLAVRKLLRLIWGPKVEPNPDSP